MRRTKYTLFGLVIFALIVTAFFLRAQITALFAAPPPPCKQDSIILDGITYPIQIVNTPPVSAPQTLPAALMLARSETAPMIWLYDTRSIQYTTDIPITLTWQDCNTITYRLQEPPSQPSADTSLTLIVEGARLYASLQEAEISIIPSPAPADLLLEISLLETQTAAETVTLSLELTNYGKQSVSITKQDISLGGGGAQSSQPPLPHKIAPGASIRLAITFARPSSLPAELRIFDTAYEISE